MLTELGHLHADRQLHALQAQGVDPFQVLVMPRGDRVRAGLLQLGVVFVLVTMVVSSRSASMLEVVQNIAVVVPRRAAARHRAGGLRGVPGEDAGHRPADRRSTACLTALLAQRDEDIGRLISRGFIPRHAGHHADERPAQPGDLIAGGCDIRSSLCRTCDRWTLFGRTAGALDLQLEPGDLALIDARDLPLASAFADLCCGLQPPAGRRSALPAAATGHGSRRRWLMPCAAWSGRSDVRSRAGCGSSTPPPMSCCQQIHHTRSDLDGLREDAARLASAFPGCPGCPTDRSASCRPADLVRVGLSARSSASPGWSILESPVQGLYQDMVPALLNRLWEVRDRGGATDLADAQPHDLGQPAVPATHRLRLDHQGLVRDQGGRMIRLRRTDEWVGALVMAAVALLLIAALQAGVLREWSSSRPRELRLVLPSARRRRSWKSAPTSRSWAPGRGG